VLRDASLNRRDGRATVERRQPFDGLDRLLCRRRVLVRLDSVVASVPRRGDADDLVVQARGARAEEAEARVRGLESEN
jgi:hypothetical protein